MKPTQPESTPGQRRRPTAPPAAPARATHAPSTACLAGSSALLKLARVMVGLERTDRHEGAGRAVSIDTHASSFAFRIDVLLGERALLARGIDAKKAREAMDRLSDAMVALDIWMYAGGKVAIAMDAAVVQLRKAAGGEPLDTDATHTESSTVLRQSARALGQATRLLKPTSQCRRGRVKSGGPV